MFLNPYYSGLLFIFFILAALMLIDKNVADYFILVLRIAKITLERYIWMIRFHPKNPITNFIMKRRYAKIAKELHQDLNNGRKI
jgi:hypothetical protein